MWSLDRRACATLALLALAGLAGIAPVDARGEDPRGRREQRPAQGARQPVRREVAAQQSRRAHVTRTEGVRAAASQEASRARQRAAVTGRKEMVGRSTRERRPADGSVAGGAHPGGGGRAQEVPRGPTGNQVHVVRFGNTLSGTVERTIRPGFMSRTFISGGHVLYTHVYQRHEWHQFGRAFEYETYVPGVRYPAVYYAWALAAWPRPVTYAWGWQVQPWYPTYGSLFTPYPVYTSPDLWMTDYIIAQSMQAAYEAQTVAPALTPAPQEAPQAAAPDSSLGASAAQPSDAAPAAQPSDAPPAPQSRDAPPAPAAVPPAITLQVKAQLNAQIKVQLHEQQAATAMPATLTTQSGPPALRPSHVFFQVVQPLDVPSGTVNGHCSLSADDYIKRTGGMSKDDWMIPVVVELSGPSDCPEGLATRIGLNDLNAMENEQEAQVMQAMQAASKSMGPNGPPTGAHPTLIADGSAAPDPSALAAIQQAR